MPRRKQSAPFSEVSNPVPAVSVSHSQDSGARAYLLLSMFVKATLLAATFTLTSLVIAGAIFAYVYLHRLAVSAGTNISSLFQAVRSGWNETVPQTQGRSNFLILGVDTLGTRSSEAINTDTIMMASVNLQSGRVTTFSLPRDLFLTDRKVKINGVYDLARKAGSLNPEREVLAVVESLIDQPVHSVIVLEIDEVGKIIDALGGISITVDHSFTDTQFPREGVDVTQVKDPKILYETVSFSAGPQRMDGKTALEFIRSRHSPDPLEGTDDARALRQQKVIEALVTRLTDRNLVRNPAYIGSLLRLYQQNIAKFVPLEEMVALGKVFLTLKRAPTFVRQHLPIQGQDSNPVFQHPNRFYTGQWVYLLTDASGKQIKLVISDWLR